MTRIAAYIKSLKAPFEIAQYKKSALSPKLNIGCGLNILEGWLNVDADPTRGAVKLDIVKSWPFEENYFDAVLCEHMIEHISKEAALRLIKNVYRTLKPGKFCRFITPDLGWIASKLSSDNRDEDVDYLDFLSDLLGRPIKTWCDAINVAFYEYGHRFIWTFEELSVALESVGFQDLRISRATQWTQPVFDGVEGHIRIAGPKLAAAEAFSIEARKDSLI